MNHGYSRVWNVIQRRRRRTGKSGSSGHAEPAGRRVVRFPKQEPNFPRRARSSANGGHRQKPYAYHRSGNIRCGRATYSRTVRTANRSAGRGEGRREDTNHRPLCARLRLAAHRYKIMVTSVKRLRGSIDLRSAHHRRGGHRARGGRTVFCQVANVRRSVGFATPCS